LDDVYHAVCYAEQLYQLLQAGESCCLIKGLKLNGLRFGPHNIKSNRYGLMTGITLDLNFWSSKVLGCHYCGCHIDCKDAQLNLDPGLAYERGR